jgi:hypothetical protein
LSVKGLRESARDLGERRTEANNLKIGIMPTLGAWTLPTRGTAAWALPRGRMGIPPKRGRQARLGVPPRLGSAAIARRLVGRFTRGARQAPTAGGRRPTYAIGLVLTEARRLAG